MMPRLFLVALVTWTIAVTARAQDFDVIIKGGAVYDGTGGEAQRVDLAIKGDRIAGLGDFKNASAKTIVNARGLAVAPGFINMLSWSTESLIQDGRSQSEIRQGVTTEIIELCKVAAKYKGKYISHMRSEGNQLFESFDELLRIAREANIPAELYHIKAAGQKNWGKIDSLLSRIESVQKEGLNVRAN